MQVSSDIDAYNVESLLEEYHAKTRLWLYDDVSAWLSQEACAQGTCRGGGVDAATGPSSRMYLLLAGPGMGKSVFSAVVVSLLLLLGGRKVCGRAPGLRQQDEAYVTV